MPQQPTAKRQREITTLDEFLMMAKEVQRLSGQKICADVTEDCRFQDFFGVGVHVAIITWTLLVENALLPEGATVPRLLWAMYFLFCYPKQEECCATAGTQEKGAVNPKTWWKYIWPYTSTLAELEHVVVSYCFLFS